MKRLFPLLFSLALVGVIAGVPTAQAQSTSKAADGSFFPIARADTVKISTNTTVDIDVLANDTETNAGLGTPTICPAPPTCEDAVLEPLHGEATVERAGTGVEDDFIRYVPDEDYAGVDSLIYEIANGLGADEEATVLIFINEPPVARPDSFNVLPETTVQLDVLANDTDAEGDPLGLESIFRVPLHGTAGIATVGETDVIVYTPTSNFVGRDSLRYVVTDGKEGRDTTTVQLVVNTPPVAVADLAKTLPNTSVEIDVLANDTDADGDELTVVSIVEEPGSGTATIIDDGQKIRYRPPGSFTGTTSFRYAIADPQGGGDTTTVVVEVNTPPVAGDDEATTAIDTPVEIDVLANDTDGNGDPLTIAAIVEAPDNGTAQIIDDGQRIRYTPDDGFTGTDTFDYAITDGEGGEDQARVTVVVLNNGLVQFIHNALPNRSFDIYVNNTLVLNDFGFQTASPYLQIDAGEAQVDVTDAEATNNSDPFFSTTVTVEPTVAYVAIATGVIEQNFSFVVKEDARLTAPPGFVEFFIAHGVLDAAASGIDVRVLDPLNSNQPSQVLADDLNFKQATDYIGLAPGIYNIDVTNFNTSTLYDVFQFELGGLAGQTLTLVLSGLLQPTGDNDPPFTLIAFDNQGNSLLPTIVTATDDELELPTDFVLRGNFPNPFNPTTTLQFDLPATAEVSVEIIDVLGRSVLRLPAKPFEAGAKRSLEINADRLASGTYLYRVLARTATETMVRTGRMTLVK